MNKSNSRRKRKKENIESKYYNFKSNINGLKEFAKSLSSVVSKKDEDSIKIITRQMDSIFKKGQARQNKRSKKNEINLKLTHAEFTKLIKLIESQPIGDSSHSAILFKSSFVILVSYFDYLIADIIRHYHKSFPDSLNSKDITLSLADLKICKTINDATEMLVNKKVENLLYRSLDDQLEYFTNYLKINMNEIEIKWENIHEIKEKRNIIVHNNGIVNNKYISNIRRHKLTTNEDLKEGTKIDITSDFFFNSLEEIFIVGTILMQSCWRKWHKKQVEQQDADLNTVMIDALTNEEWKIAEMLGRYAMNCEVSDERMKMVNFVNYVQALKWQGREDEVEEKLQTWDISSLDPVFTMAYYVLKSDKQQFYNILPSIVKSKGIKKDEFFDWPLFREFRKITTFRTRINNLYKK